MCGKLRLSERKKIQTHLLLSRNGKKRSVHFKLFRFGTIHAHSDMRALKEGFQTGYQLHNG
ncbi:MAG: hypothetical protein CMO55_08740 [Verrucomicrobiales bacterium]|nr:hypothetical protein [Verrucomicrobiales bacterium]